eukprot:scaffold5781_cov124-Isochrysis_galbana.AAC.23
MLPGTPGSERLEVVLNGTSLQWQQRGASTSWPVSQRSSSEHTRAQSTVSERSCSFRDRPTQASCGCGSPSYVAHAT